MKQRSHWTLFFVVLAAFLALVVITWEKPASAQDAPGDPPPADKTKPLSPPLRHYEESQSREAVSMTGSSTTDPKGDTDFSRLTSTEYATISGKVASVKFPSWILKNPSSLWWNSAVYHYPSEKYVDYAPDQDKDYAYWSKGGSVSVTDATDSGLNAYEDIKVARLKQAGTGYMEMSVEVRGNISSAPKDAYTYEIFSSDGWDVEIYSGKQGAIWGYYAWGDKKLDWKAVGYEDIRSAKVEDLGNGKIKLSMEVNQAVADNPPNNIGDVEYVWTIDVDNNASTGEPGGGYDRTVKVRYNRDQKKWEGAIRKPNPTKHDFDDVKSINPEINGKVISATVDITDLGLSKTFRWSSSTGARVGPANQRFFEKIDRAPDSGWVETTLNDPPDVEVSTFSFLDDQPDSLLHAEDMTVSVEVYNAGGIPVQGEVCLSLDGEDIEDGCEVFPDNGKELQPGRNAFIKIPWRLDGYANNRIENGKLEVVATITDRTDATPDNNTYSDVVTIYWADFATGFDGYQFANDKSLTEALWKIDIRDLLGLIYKKHLAQVWNLAWDLYTGADGLCFGMSATSILYHQANILIPGANDFTYALSQNEALPNIRKYHRNQLIFYKSHGFADTKPPVIETEFGKVETLLKKSKPKPAEIRLEADSTSLNNSSGTVAHSVVVYKTIRTEKDNTRNMFVYNPNYPFDASAARSSARKIRWSDVIAFSNSGYENFTAHEIGLLSLSDDEIVKLAIDIARKEQAELDVLTVFVGSPVESLITDESGRRIGSVNGKDVSEIPGAIMERFGEEIVFILPDDGDYSFKATGLSDVAPGDSMTLAYQRSAGDDSVLEVAFNDLPVESNKVYTTKFGSSETAVPPIMLPDGSSKEPDEVDTVNVDSPSGIYKHFVPISVTNR